MSDMATKPDDMVIVNGVRYRPEDAPKRAAEPEQEPSKKAAPAARNKARASVNNK